MKYAFALLTLGVISGCSAKHPHQKKLFIFVNVRADGKCEVNDKLTKWDAKTGALVLTCK